jgi:hypothetical protein
MSRYGGDLYKGRSALAFKGGYAMVREPPMKSGGSMQSKIDAYIAHRHQGGCALSREATQLANFARFADKIGHRGPLTLELASRWALASEHDRSITAARRIEVLRGFARYYQQLAATHAAIHVKACLIMIVSPIRIFPACQGAACATARRPCSKNDVSARRGCAIRQSSAARSSRSHVSRARSRTRPRSCR